MWAALAVSAVAHVVALAAGAWNGAAATVMAGGEEAPVVINVVDVNRAPEAPEAVVAKARVPAVAVKARAPVAKAHENVAEVVIPGDGGPADGGPADGGAWDGDAGAGAMVSASGDGGPGDGDGGAVAVAAATGDGGPAGDEHPGANADLGPYVPDGEVITVILRFDRLRGTEWATGTRKVLAPMPDYRAIIGGRDISLADAVDTLVITSRDPRQVTATTLAAHSQLEPAALRKVIGGGNVRWSAVTGGAMGQRANAGTDPRVYLMPYPHWVVFAEPGDLGGLTAARQGPLDVATAGDSGPRVIPDGGLPGWLARLRDIEIESGTGEEGPAVVVSARGFPETVHIQRVGDVPGPTHAAVALTVAPLGFYVRGTLTFADAAAAAELVEVVNAARDRLMGSMTGQLLLRGAHAYHAVHNLSLARSGSRVGLATSVSTADGRAMMDLAAAWSKEFYSARTPHH